MRTALALLAILLAVPAAQALIVAEPSRLDVGELEPGTQGTWTLTITNKGDEPVDVATRLELPQDEPMQVVPDRFHLEAHASAPLSIRLAVPAALAGGRHDPRVSLLETSGASGDAHAQGGVTVPVVFWVDAPKLGALTASPVSAGDDATARVLVQNYLTHLATTDLTITLRDAAGAFALVAHKTTDPVEPNASMSVDVPLPTSALAPGAYSVEAKATSEGHPSNTLTTTLLVGDRRLAIDAPKAVVAAHGASFEAVVRNAGTVILGGELSIDVVDLAGATRTVARPIAPLEPGASQPVVLNATLLPGTYTWTAHLTWPGGAVEGTGAAFTVEPEQLGALQVQTTAPVPFVSVGLLLGLIAVAAVLRAWRSR